MLIALAFVPVPVVMEREVRTFLRLSGGICNSSAVWASATISLEECVIVQVPSELDIFAAGCLLIVVSENWIFPKWRTPDNVFHINDLSSSENPRELIAVYTDYIAYTIHYYVHMSEISCIVYRVNFRAVTEFQVVKLIRISGQFDWSWNDQLFGIQSSTQLSIR